MRDVKIKEVDFYYVTSVKVELYDKKHIDLLIFFLSY